MIRIATLAFSLYRRYGRGKRAVQKTVQRASRPL